VNGQFCVPVGAMQFKVSPRAISVYKRTPVIWVLPSVPRKDFKLAGCKCTEVYPVIEELIPAKYQGMMESNRKERNPNGKFFVCACMGEVIE
jgi:hypothetical protein